MSKTTHLGLNTWGESENSGTWLAWRLAMAGTDAASNMEIIDAWAKTIEEELANIQPKLEFDNVPTDGSSNPVTSNGIYKSLGEKASLTGANFTGPISIGNAAIEEMGTNTLVVGESSVANGTNSVSIGTETGTNGTNSLAVGMASYAYGGNSVAFGEGSSAIGTNSIVVGKYNEEDYGETYAWIVGNGDDANNRRNIALLDWEGNFYVTADIVDGQGNCLSQKQDTLKFDETPTESSANVVMSGGVYAALEERQPRIYESGILIGDGSGDVHAAEVGVDYAAPDHNHEGVYCTSDELTDAVAELAPAFSPVVDVTFTNTVWTFGFSVDHLGKTLKVVTTSGSTEDGCQLYPAPGEQYPVGFECEVIWYDGTDKLKIASTVNPDGTPIDKMYNALEETGDVPLYVASQYGVAVLKKIGENEWIVGGDITL